MPKSYRNRRQKYCEMDYISSLPFAIIETIISRLPIREIARTSVLSKEWRYHYTKVSKTSFDEELSAAEIDLILHHGSLKQSVKELRLNLSSRYTLPMSFFSLIQLTKLYLRDCEIDLIPTTFGGFGRLTSLFMEELKTTKEKLVYILSKSPLLKTVTLNIGCDYINDSGDFSILDLFNCLPVIENLSIWCTVLQCFRSPYGVPQKLQTTLVHLKYFCIEGVCFIEDDIVMLALVIKSSPNLEKLKVQIMQECCEDKPRGSFTLKDYSDIRVEHLNELEIINVSKKKNAELDFVTLILAKSPVLKNARIFLYNGAAKAKKGKILNILSRSPHASPAVAITVGHYREEEN